MSGSPSSGIRPAAYKTGAGNVSQTGDLAIGKSDVNVLSAASLCSTEESCHDGVAGVEASCKICYCNADFGWRAVAMACYVHETHLTKCHISQITRRISSMDLIAYASTITS